MDDRAQTASGRSAGNARLRGAGPAAAIAVPAAAIALVVAAIALVAVTPAPASAHTVSGPRPTNFRTRVVAITPRVPGLRLRVVDLGNRLELVNRTSTDVVVLGYDGEPYLRVGPRGVFENRRSPATYLNRTRAGTTRVARVALDATARTPPDWHRVSGGHVARWHDHRVHWMPARLPREVRADPGHFHAIVGWTVVLLDGGRRVRVAGRLDWVPGPSGRPWLPAIAVLFALGFAVARGRRRSAAIGLLVAMVGLDATHAITAEVARPGAPLAKTLQFFGDNFVSVIVWIVAAVTIWALGRRRVEALYGMLLTGAMLGLVSGLTDLSYLWSSQLPTAGAHALARAEVACALGLGLGVAAGALVALRRSSPHPPARDARDPHWVERLVGDLGDEQVAVVSGRLDANEVIPRALSDLAVRAAPVAGGLGADALVFGVLAQDEIGTHVWSIVAGQSRSGESLRVQRGRPAPVRVELRTTFPVFLQLLAGTTTIEESTASGRLHLVGDPALVAAVAPYLSVTRSQPGARDRYRVP